VLYGAPASSIQVLQRVQNNAAGIVLQAARRSHAQPLLRELHWLPIQHRIEYKVAVLTFKSRSSATAPTSISQIKSEKLTIARHHQSSGALVTAD